MSRAPSYRDAVRGRKPQAAAGTISIPRPSLAELQRNAATLARRDLAVLEAADDKARARETQLRDKQRDHASRVALPSEWRTRDKLTGAELPARTDLATYRALGRSDALRMRPPRQALTDNQPHSLAYCRGHLEIQFAYMMPDQHQTTTIVARAAELHQLRERDLGNYMLTGDVTALKPDARAVVLVAMAKHVGLDPLERPFMLMQDGKRTVIYARAACSDALCRERSIDTSQDSVEEQDVCGTRQIVARATATLIDIKRLRELVDAGVPPEASARLATRSKTALGAVAILQPNVEWKTSENGKRYKDVTGWREPTPAEASNLIMKATTKAERRAVIKLVGLGGVVDETELHTIDPAGNADHYEAVVEDREPGDDRDVDGEQAQ